MPFNNFNLFLMSTLQCYFECTFWFFCSARCSYLLLIISGIDFGNTLTHILLVPIAQFPIPNNRYRHATSCPVLDALCSDVFLPRFYNVSFSNSPTHTNWNHLFDGLSLEPCLYSVKEQFVFNTLAGFHG